MQKNNIQKLCHIVNELILKKGTMRAETFFKIQQPGTLEAVEKSEKLALLVKTLRKQ